MTTTQHSSTKQAILQLLQKEGQKTASELADALEISPQAIRRHLKELEGGGLIEHKQVQIGMGRPQHLYQGKEIRGMTIDVLVKDWAV
ncbi:MAG: winged helix-turn-helix transcriptional regulator [Symploca sp. SIO3E6]|nr:winged helix-turn-helix transcriptional regulator [Caldora sp. SIO3E6]